MAHISSKITSKYTWRVVA